MTTTADSPNGFFAEFLDDFFAECDEHLTAIRRNLLLLEATVGQEHVPQVVVNDLFRSFHSLKGLAGMVGAGALEQVAHAIENVLRLLRQEQIVLTREVLDVLVAATGIADAAIMAFQVHDPAPALDTIVARLAALEDGVEHASAPPTSQPTSSVVLGGEERERLAEARAHDIPVWLFMFSPSPALAERGMNVNVVRERLQGLGTIIRAVPNVLPGGVIRFEFVVATPAAEEGFADWHDDGLSYEPYEAPTTPAPQPPATTNGDTSAPPPVIAPSNNVRVDLERLDELMQHIGDLVIVRTRLAERLRGIEALLPVAEQRELQEVNRLLERHLRQLRATAMRTRMVPVGDVFARMQFVARDLARGNGKQVRLELSGHETAIDKYIVDHIADPLLHLVRNAISHGIESPDERSRAGKSPEGLIALRAVTTGDEVVIEVEDDGAGVDLAVIEGRARELGVLDASEPFKAEHLLDVLCAPGFSTRDAADRGSGRGVGMAAVRQRVLELGGTMSLRSTVGSGSRFILRLPLTLLIVDALIVVVAGQRYAVPLAAVRELLDLRRFQPVHFENNTIISFRGQVLPLLHLARYFGAHATDQEHYVMVVGDDSELAGLVVDRLVEKREIVVRSLGDPLLDIAGLRGATELGDGRVVLILDVPGIVRGAEYRKAARMGASTPGEGHVMVRQPDRPAETEPYILFDLAGTTYGIPSRQVQRMELLEEITPVPNAHPVLEGVVLSRGQPVPAISLRARFHYAKVPHDLRSRLIVVTVGERTVGLVVDTAREFVKIAPEMIQAPPETLNGLSGRYVQSIAMLGERPVLLLDLAAVLDLTDLHTTIPEHANHGEM